MAGDTCTVITALELADESYEALWIVYVAPIYHEQVKWHNKKGMSVKIKYRVKIK
jgi:hypothetical protein